MPEDPNRRDDTENGSAADADTTSDVTSEGRRGERGAGTSPGAGSTALESAEGKDVVDHEGQTVGVVERVEGSTLYVEPDSGITDRISTMLGWGDDDSDRSIDADRVDEVTDDSVVLKYTDDVDVDAAGR